MSPVRTGKARESHPQPASTRSGPLAHIRICDFTGQLAGAGATKFLAAFGAQVIRIEDPVRQGRWDILRGAPPVRRRAARASTSAARFNNHNVEKLGITLNLRTERGRELLERPRRASPTSSPRTSPPA